MTDATRYDVVPIKATIDPDTGYLHDTPVLTRTGIFEYRRADGSMQREYRPPAAVFHPDHLRSLSGKPIVVGHPGMVTSKNARQHQIGTVLGQGRQDGDTLVADVVLHDPSSVMDGGMRELSLGYRITLDETPGVTPEGEKYDAVQSVIVANHLGVVPKGRAGVSRFNLDSADVVEANGDNHTMPDVTLADVRLDSGLSYKAAPEVAHAITTLRADLAAAVSRADAASATADSTRAALDTAKAKHDSEVAGIRADAVAQVRARMDMEAKATGLGVTVAADASDNDLRVAVIRKVRGDALDLTGKSVDYVAAAYDLAVADGVKRHDSAAQQRQQVATGNPAARQDSAGSTSMSAADARKAFIARRLGEKE